MTFFKRRKRDESSLQQAGELGGGKIAKRQEGRFLNAEHMLKAFSKEKGFPTPLELLMSPADKRDAALLEFCNKALKEGKTESEISDALVKWGYAKKLMLHQPTNKDQAAGAYLFASTSKVDWLDMLFGGLRIVEDGKLLNGVFGRATTNHLDGTDVKAAALYLSSHDLEKDLPQAPMLMFGGRSDKVRGNGFENEKSGITADRDNFESSLGNRIVGKHFFKISDAKHDTTLKFRICCVVWDEELARLMVVSDKSSEPTPFGEWVRGKNHNDILSASDEQISHIEAYVKRTGLIEKMTKTGQGSKPWSDLLEDVKRGSGIYERIESEGDYYRQAVKIWRYAMLEITATSVAAYERRWATIKRVQEIMNTNLKLVCDDGRQEGNAKVLGAILTEDEFGQLFSDYNRQMKVLRFIPHYACGFLTAAQEIHKMIELLRLSISIDGMEGFEKERKLEFFESRFRLMIEDRKHGPVAEWEVLRDYLPDHLADELSDLMRQKPAINNEARSFVSGLYTLFCDSGAGGEKLRSVAQRAVDVGVFAINGNGFLHMPSASITHERLRQAYGSGYRSEFSPDQINALITEEVARDAHRKYLSWVPRQRFKIEFGMENFITGQITEVPPDAQNLKNMVRNDYYLANKFTPEEINDAGLEKFAQWKIPKANKN